VGYCFVKGRVIGEFDSDTGDVNVFLFRPSCRERERLPMRWLLRFLLPE
jgi:hypothetical protein